MSKIYTSMLQLVGNTPLLKPERYNSAAGISANLLLNSMPLTRPALPKTVSPRP